MQQLDWFLDPVKHHYFDFDGRVTRQTFWMFVLWSFIISFVIGLVSEDLAGLFSLAVFLPSIGLGARRLHDTSMSGWWQLIGVIPLIGWVIIIVLLARQGNAGPNEYGPDPRTVASPMPFAPSAGTPSGAEGQVSAPVSTPTDSEVR